MRKRRRSKYLNMRKPSRERKVLRQLERAGLATLFEVVVNRYGTVRRVLPEQIEYWKDRIL